MSFVLKSIIQDLLFICSCAFTHSHSFACLFLLRLKQYRSDDESYDGTNTEDPAVDFEREADRIEEEEDDAGFSPELERMVAQED